MANQTGKILALIAVIGWIGYNWWTLSTQGRYWTGAEFAFPIIGVWLLAQIIRPSLMEKPRRLEDNKIYYATFAISLIVGVVHSYFMMQAAGRSLF